jgi:hypothetical protein
LNSTDQPDDRATLGDGLFNLQGHVGAYRRNERAIRNYRKDGKLHAVMMLIFRQKPNRQQGPAKSEEPNPAPGWLLSASSERQ